MTAASGKVRIAEHIEIEWREADAARGVARQYGIAALARDYAGQSAGQNAIVAQANLALTVDDPPTIPDTLAALPLSPVQKATVLPEGFVRLVNAGHYEAASAFSTAHDVPVLLAQAEPDTARNARLARVTLDLAVGDPAVIPALLDPVEMAQAERETLLLLAFTRLANAGRHAEARGFAAAHDVRGTLSRHSGEAAADAAIGLATLALADGDAAEVPALLEGREIAAARRETLLLQAFTRLANAGRYAEAREFAATQNVSGMMLRQRGEMAADAATGLAVLELNGGDPALVSALLQEHEIAADQRRVLLCGAFTRLENAQRHADAQ